MKATVLTQTVAMNARVFLDGLGHTVRLTLTNVPRIRVIMEDSVTTKWASLATPVTVQAQVCYMNN